MSDMTRRKAAGGLARQLRPSRLLIGVSAAAVAAAVLASSGSAASRPSLARPSGLHTFIKQLDEPRRFAAADVPEYSRTPSFAWAPVRGATRYEFELSTSEQFRADNGLVWSSKTLLTPATTIPLSLPWITGDPASLYWRVRAVSGSSVSAWSAPQPFSMRWSNVPTEWRPDSGSPADRPGYVRWHPVDGATSYQVWFVNSPLDKKVISTITNVADEREYYKDNKGWTGDVTWRVRAVRRVYGKTSNKLPVVSHGPWSPEYTWTNTTDPLASGTDVQPVAAVSDRVSTPDRPDVHGLMPAFLFAGNGDTPEGQHRVYVFSDSDCVNPVFTGPRVGGPAYAPRTSGPIDSPQGVTLDWAPSHDVGGPEWRFRLDPVGCRRRQAGRGGRVRGSEGRSLGSGLEAGRPLLLRRRAGQGRGMDTRRPSCRRTRARERLEPSASWRSARTAQTPCRSRRRSGCHPPGDCSWGRRARLRSTGLRS